MRCGNLADQAAVRIEVLKTKGPALFTVLICYLSRGFAEPPNNSHTLVCVDRNNFPLGLTPTEQHHGLPNVAVPCSAGGCLCRP